MRKSGKLLGSTNDLLIFHFLWPINPLNVKVVKLNFFIVLSIKRDNLPLCYGHHGVNRLFFFFSFFFVYCIDGFTLCFNWYPSLLLIFVIVKEINHYAVTTRYWSKQISKFLSSPIRDENRWIHGPILGLPN